jgi:hypothetical protein
MSYFNTSIIQAFRATEGKMMYREDLTVALRRGITIVIQRVSRTTRGRNRRHEETTSRR